MSETTCPLRRGEIHALEDFKRAVGLVKPLHLYDWCGFVHGRRPFPRVAEVRRGSACIATRFCPRDVAAAQSAAGTARRRHRKIVVRAEPDEAGAEGRRPRPFATRPASKRRAVMKAARGSVVSARPPQPVGDLGHVAFDEAPGRGVEGGGCRPVRRRLVSGRTVVRAGEADLAGKRKPLFLHPECQRAPARLAHRLVDGDPGSEKLADPARIVGAGSDGRF